MKKLPVVKKAHADLGASSAHRWMNCPGSVALSVDMPDYSTEYKREGTAAHTLLERCLRKKLDAVVWLDTEIPVTEYNEDGSVKEVHQVSVTEEMCDAVQIAVDEVWKLVDHPKAKLFIEQRFDLSGLNPPGPMYGTADVVIWFPKSRRLVVVDFKYGAGVVVDVKENEQLLYYGLGAAIEVDEVPDEIQLVVVQPRAFHPDGIIRSFFLNFEALGGFAEELFAAAGETLQPNAPLIPGDWCRFCKALPVCPAQRQLAIEVAQTEFDVVEAGALQLPVPEVLSDEQLARILTVEPTLSEWLRSIRQHVMNRLDRGEVVPGWKLVDKRANRKWIDPEDAEDALGKMGLGDERFVTKLVSPAQAEKALKAVKKKLPAELVVKQSSGKNMVPDTDPRLALLPGAVADFDSDTPSEVTAGPKR